MAKLKLNTEVETKICDLLRKGNHRVNCAYGAGIDDTTFYYWLRRGKQDMSEGKETVYSHFFKAVESVEAELQQELIDIWITSAKNNKDYKSISTFLARRFSKTWGISETVKVSGDNESPLEIKVSYE